MNFVSGSPWNRMSEVRFVEGGCDAPELLTEEERDLISLLGNCFNAFTRIAGDGPTREADIGEFCSLIHHLQQYVMSQAAARAYPDLYRLIGETLSSAHGGAK